MLAQITLKAVLLAALALPLAACNEEGVDTDTAETTTVPTDDTGVATSGAVETGN